MTKGFVTLAAILIFISGCSGPSGLKFRDPQKGGGLVVKPTPTPKPNEWFNRLHAAIIKPKCVGCHQPPMPKAKVDLSTYESIMAIEGLVVPNDPDNSGLYYVVSGNEMPPPPGDPLTADEKESIHKWISAGAPKETQNP